MRYRESRILCLFKSNDFEHNGTPITIVRQKIGYAAVGYRESFFLCLFTSHEDEHNGTLSHVVLNKPLWDNGTPTALRAVLFEPPGSIPGSGVIPFWHISWILKLTRKIICNLQSTDLYIRIFLKEAFELLSFLHYNQILK